jgi:NAD(P)-dependent dehydrogenase (short-subunit alcohol dehydrogenase family)
MGFGHAGKDARPQVRRSRDLVGAAVFLCADASRYISCQVIYVDGDYLASI